MSKLTSEKAKSIKKVSKIREIKKSLTIGVIIAVVAISGIIAGIIIINSLKEEEPVILNFGSSFLLEELDPLTVQGGPDLSILYQIAEGLFDYDENGTLIYCLAINHSWSPDALNLTCTLREDVGFHDKTPFNAEAVKWNFDRIYRLINDSKFEYDELWKFPDGTPIIKETQVIENNIVRFILNEAYIPLESLLTFQSSYILSPASTPEDRFLDLDTEKTIGTGPFIFERYENLTNFEISANPEYWGGKPQIDIVIITNIASVSAALLSGDIDITYSAWSFNDDVLDTFRNNSSFVVEEEPMSNLRWLVMNNKVINTTMRKAISYALNYSFIETIGGIRAKSPIPETILYHNTTGINMPSYDVSIARQTLKDVNWNNTAGALIADNNISAGNEWEKLVDNGTPLAKYNYTYVDNHPLIPPPLKTLLTENLKQIGVKVEPVNVSFSEYRSMLDNTYGYNRDMLELCYGWWAVDYNDPNNFIEPLFSNETAEANFGQINDPLTKTMITEALVETNPQARRLLYYDIQKQLIEEVYPIALSYSTFQGTIYVSNLKGWYSNVGNWPLKHVYFEFN